MSDDRDEPPEPMKKGMPRPKAEPRVSLAPLEFEDALGALMGVQPPTSPADSGPSEEGDRSE